MRAFLKVSDAVSVAPRGCEWHVVLRFRASMMALLAAGSFLEPPTEFCGRTVRTRLSEEGKKLPDEI